MKSVYHILFTFKPSKTKLLVSVLLCDVHLLHFIAIKKETEHSGMFETELEPIISRHGGF